MTPVPDREAPAPEAQVPDSPALDSPALDSPALDSVALDSVALDAEPGTIFTFRTHPRFPDSPTPTGRFAATKVIGRSKRRVVLMPYGEIWAARPNLSLVTVAPTLRRGSKGRGVPMTVTLEREDAHGLLEVETAGHTQVTSAEAQLAKGPLTAPGYDHPWGEVRELTDVLEERWRYAHEPALIAAERVRASQRREQEEAAERLRAETRLNTLTAEQLLAEPLLERWVESPPFPPARFRRAIIKRIRQAQREVQELDANPPRAEVTAILRGLIDWVTQADAAAGWVIESEERQDLHEVLDDLAHAAKHPSILTDLLESTPW